MLSGLRLQRQGQVNEVVDYQKAWQEEYGQDLPQTAKPEVERYLGVLLQIAPDSIGGAVPDARFYYGF
ncbi:hypothetical protein [Brevibacillus agri]|uniref:hypothetical protein n=1 Tax=Brevibacillus agri TaxID=51101 RepID=UPI0030F3F142